MESSPNPWEGCLWQRVHGPTSTFISPAGGQPLFGSEMNVDKAMWAGWVKPRLSGRHRDHRPAVGLKEIVFGRWACWCLPSRGFNRPGLASAKGRINHDKLTRYGKDTPSRSQLIIEDLSGKKHSWLWPMAHRLEGIRRRLTTDDSQGVFFLFAGAQ